VTERERAPAAESVASEQRDCRVREVEDSVDHWEETVRVGERVGVALVLVDASAPELRVVATGDDSAFGIVAQGSLNVVEGLDHFVADLGV